MVRSIDKYLSKGFYKYAGLVHRFWPWFIAVPLVLCVPCIAGFTFMKARRQGKYETTEYIFTPTNADSLYEKACIAEHWPLDFNRYLPGKSSQVKRWIEVLIVAKDNGNLLRSEYIEEAFRAGEFILNNLTVKGLDDNTKIGYEQLCMKWDGECFSNIQLALLKERKAISKYFTLTYPIANLEVAPVYVANLLGGVEINSNGTVRSVKGVRMLFALIHEPDVFDVLSLQWTYSLQHYIEAYKGNYTDMAIFHSKSLDDGLEDNALTLVPRFSVSMMVLVIFSVLCSLTTVQVPHWRIPLIDWHKSRVILAVGGVLCAGVGIAAAMGFLMLVGTPYNPIVAVMPFLVIGNLFLSLRKR